MTRTSRDEIYRKNATRRREVAGDKGTVPGTISDREI